MKQTLIVTVFCTGLAPAAGLGDQITVIDASGYDWEPTPEGVAFAAVQGDRFRESYQALVRLPAGTVSPPHIKSASMFGVMLQGEMIHYPAGVDAGTATPVGAGGFYHIPQGLAHISACVSADPCIAYLYQDGAFDFLPVPQ